MNQLGVIGLGTMGANLARNAARNGAKVVVYNRTTETTDEFMSAYGSDGNFVATKSYEELAAALTPPRAVLLMVKAGEPTFAVARELSSVLSKGDIIIDGGNSFYKDSQALAKELSEKGILLLAMGVSGGESGALNGPSMMPGGEKKAFEIAAPLLTKMAADDGSKGKCISFLGPDGAGHFVKMVHNGIEYGIMQLLAELYSILKNLSHSSNAEIATVFDRINHDAELTSFLTEITAKILKTPNDSGKGELIDVIKDAAGQKGTGKWTTVAALNYGVAIPTITAAVDARILSGSNDLRGYFKEAATTIDAVLDAKELEEQVISAFELASILAYLQGFFLIQRASEEEKWNVPMSEAARIWKGGCIIRSALLERFEPLWNKKNEMQSTAWKKLMKSFSEKKLSHFRSLVASAQIHGLPVPALAASLSYFDSLRTATLPQVLIQAQRDFFGAHTFERTDKPGIHHFNWPA